jgi:7-cyano-7-deazaguanine synthase in queuosine biosynthesis
MLQQIGLLDNQEIADQIAETERKQDVLVSILRDVAKDYPDIRREIMKRLSQITGVVEPIEIIESKNVI